MIVTEDSDAVAAKRAANNDAPVIRQEEQDAAGGQPLPAYTPNAGASTQRLPNLPISPPDDPYPKSSVQFPSGGGGLPPGIPYNTYDGYYSLAYLQLQQKGKRAARKRFWKALCVAVLVYLLFWALVNSIVDLARSASRRHHDPWDGSGRGRPRAVDGTIVECIYGDEWTWRPFAPQLTTSPASQQTNTAWSIPAVPSPTPRWPYPSPSYQAYASFSLPSSAELLYFLSRGNAHGSIKFDVDPSLSASKGTDIVNVGIVASYYTNEGLDRVSVCQLKRDGGQHGVGVYGPTYSRGGDWRDNVRFDLTVLFPETPSPLVIKALQTEFSIFSHEFGDLENSVIFEKLNIRTSNSNVNAGSLFAKNAVIKSSNGPISGSYNTSDSLEIITSNTPIKANVALHSVDRSDGRPTSLVLRTSNGQIVVPVTLSTTSTSPNYTISAKTSNTPIELAVSYPSPPPRSPSVSLDARTSNAHAAVRLGAAYEGSFDINTSNARAEVDAGVGIEDPWGEGRKRTVSYKASPFPRGRGAKGAVWWSKGNEDRGKVVVTTSNAPVMLQLY